jgi:hypothetical protein
MPGGGRAGRSDRSAAPGFQPSRGSRRRPPAAAVADRGVIDRRRWCSEFTTFRLFPEKRRKSSVNGSIELPLCRYPPRDSAYRQPPLLRRSRTLRYRRAGTSCCGWTPLSALPAGESGAEILVPHWLAATQRVQLATAVRAALTGRLVHPVAAIHLEDVLTELHVAAARDAVWPASAARVRLATGWDEDVLPVRLSAAELAGVLALPDLPDVIRTLLAGGAVS